MSIDREELRRAKRAARHAARLDMPITTCPWPVRGTPHERALATLWISTYLTHRPERAALVDYSG